MEVLNGGNRAERSLEKHLQIQPKASASASLGLCVRRSDPSSTSHRSYVSYWSYSPTAAMERRNETDEFLPFLKRAALPDQRAAAYLARGDTGYLARMGFLIPFYVVLYLGMCFQL